LAAHLIWPQPDSCLIFSLSFQGVIALEPARRCYSVSRLPSLRSPIQSLNQSLLTLPLPEYAISYFDGSARYFSSCESLPPTGLVLEALHPRARSEAATRLGDPMILTTQSNSDRSNKRRRLNDQFQPLPQFRGSTNYFNSTYLIVRAAHVSQFPQSAVLRRRSHDSLPPSLAPKGLPIVSELPI
jgi:hypothetical protein